MDRTIDNKRPRVNKYLLWGVITVLSLSIYLFFIRDNSNKYNVEANSLNYSVVTSGDFSEYIVLEGTIEPEQSVILDAIQGGIIEEIFIEDGAMVEAGQELLRMSNPDMELEYMNRENFLYDIINNLQNSRLSIEQNRLQLRQDLLEIDYQLANATRNFYNDSILNNSGAIPKDQFNNSRTLYYYLVDKRILTIESQKRDSIATMQQIRQLSSSSERLYRNLSLLEKNLMNLVVKTPISGQLSSLNVSLGQSIPQGSTLGQIDVPDKFKVNASMADRYINRVSVGQQANFTYSNTEFTLEIQKIYPDVVDGQFEIDLAFVGDIPQDFRRGQSLNVNLQFSAQEHALMIAKGRFYNDTGGQWIFVYDEENGTAERREIQIGKQNSRNYQVLSGLKEGEKVIISPYTNFLEKDKLIISEE
jgi:HlyD family secretion protein